MRSWLYGFNRIFVHADMRLRATDGPMRTDKLKMRRKLHIKMQVVDAVTAIDIGSNPLIISRLRVFHSIVIKCIHIANHMGLIMVFRLADMHNKR